jgi:hypothetical protein
VGSHLLRSEDARSGAHQGWQRLHERAGGVIRAVVVALALSLTANAGLIWGLLKANQTIGAKNEALRAAAGALKAAGEAIKGRDALLLANADREGTDATETASFWKGQCAAAFKAGYAARRCTAEDRPTLDLRQLMEAGAYRPHAATSADEQ